VTSLGDDVTWEALVYSHNDYLCITAYQHIWI